MKDKSKIEKNEGKRQSIWVHTSYHHIGCDTSTHYLIFLKPITINKVILCSIIISS